MKACPWLRGGQSAVSYWPRGGRTELHQKIAFSPLPLPHHTELGGLLGAWPGVTCTSSVCPGWQGGPAGHSHFSHESQRGRVTAMYHTAHVWRGMWACLAPKGRHQCWPVHHCIPSSVCRVSAPKRRCRDEWVIQSAMMTKALSSMPVFFKHFDTIAFYIATHAIKQCLPFPHTMPQLAEPHVDHPL